MTFALGIIIAIATLGVAAVFAFLGVDLGVSIPFLGSPLIQGWALGLIALLTTAFLSRRDPKANFEMVVASEVTVVYGITTLVLSIGLGVSRTADVWAAAAGPPPLDQLAPAMRIFAEGFVAAGVSPFCAVALRQIDVLARTGGAGGEVGAVGGASHEIEQLRDAITEAAHATTAFGAAMAKLTNGLETVSSSMDAARSSGQRLVDGLDSAGEAAKDVSGRFQPAADQIARLTAAAEEGATLLDGLRDIIASVEQFIPRSRSGGSR